MKRFPMTLQLACILFIVMVIPASILTWYSGEQSLRDSERQIAESSLAELVGMVSDLSCGFDSRHAHAPRTVGRHAVQARGCA